MIPLKGPGFPFVIKPLASRDVGEAARCYMDVFLNHEPLTSCYRISPDLFFPPALAYVSLCAEDGLSYIARDAGSGGLAGFVFCSDLSTDWSSRGPCIARMSSLFPDIAGILGRLEQYYRGHFPSGPGQSLHIFQVGITPEFQAQGVAKALVVTAVEHGRERGYSYTLAECTSPSSQALFTSCEFLEVHGVPFPDCSQSGACSPGLPGKILLMVREL